MANKLGWSVVRLVLVLAVAAVGWPAGQPAAAAPGAPLAVLFDQLNPAQVSETWVQSQDMADRPLFSRKAADDFVNTGELGIWAISQVEVAGVSVGPAGAPVVAVEFYGSGGALPGARLARQEVSGANLGGNDANGDFVLALNPPVWLGPGTYWVSVQAIKPSNNNTSAWGWNEYIGLSGAESALLTTYVDACPNWGARVSTCGSGLSPNYDLPFRLSGSYYPVAATLYLPSVLRR